MKRWYHKGFAFVFSACLVLGLPLALFGKWKRWW